jgi:hypothetical protein
MKYFRLGVMVVVLVALILWLRQCTSGDPADASANLGLTPAQIESLKQEKTDGIVPATAPTQTPKPVKGS